MARSDEDSVEYSYGEFYHFGGHFTKTSASLCLTSGIKDVDAARNFLTRAEVENLAFASRLITLKKNKRSLADHLNGDVYYKISRENHNLDRCRTQLKLLSDMEEKFEQMGRIVEKHS